MTPDHVLQRALAGEDPGADAWVAVYDAARADAAVRGRLVAVADTLRAQQVGSVVTFVVNRNINFTNVCVKACRFCAFSRDVRSEAGYLLDAAEVGRRAREAADLGATEVCLQAGLAPDLTVEDYVGLVRAVKDAAPSLHVHAFSPEEVKHAARRSGRSFREVLLVLREAGLDTLPGTSAEILDDELRRTLAPGRITTAEWVEVIRTAHQLGLPTTATMMFGHLERGPHVVRHLLLLRDLQRETGGFTEFVPLAFVHEEAPRLARRPGVRAGPAPGESIVVHALARLVLGADIPNLQVSWVKEGWASAAALLAAGANDLGGTLMNESISTQAGAAHGQLASPSVLTACARAAGRNAAERDTRYRLVRHWTADVAHALDDVDDADARFGTYRGLTQDPRFAWVRP